MIILCFYISFICILSFNRHVQVIFLPTRSKIKDVEIFKRWCLHFRYLDTNLQSLNPAVLLAIFFGPYTFWNLDTLWKVLQLHFQIKRSYTCEKMRRNQRKSYRALLFFCLLGVVRFVRYIICMPLDLGLGTWECPNHWLVIAETNHEWPNQPITINTSPPHLKCMEEAEAESHSMLESN